MLLPGAVATMQRRRREFRWELMRLAAKAKSAAAARQDCFEWSSVAASKSTESTAEAREVVLRAFKKASNVILKPAHVAWLHEVNERAREQYKNSARPLKSH